MKKIRPFVVLMLFFLLAWHVFGDSSDVTFDFDGEEIDGPLGVVAGFLFAGGGMIVAALALLFAGALLALLLAGLGAMLALGLAALVVAALVSPLLLPLLIPLAIIWFFVGRARRNRLKPNLS